MVAVVLAGGKGTRLRPFTMSIPKPLLPLGETPILEIVVRQLRSAGINRVIVAVGHMAQLIVATVGDGSQWGVTVEYCYEDSPLGTAGSLAFIEDLGENFLVLNGDILTTIDYRRLINTHLEQDAWGTIAVSKREVRVDYGVVTHGEDGTLVSYSEKPSLKYEVSMGINVLSARCLKYVAKGHRIDMPDLMLTMLRNSKKVVCFPTDCYWKDIGRFEDYQQASEDFVRDPARFLPNGGMAECQSF